MNFSQSLRLLPSDLQNPTLVSFLDLSRWVAAAAVFLAHLRIPLFVGYSDLDEGSRTVFVKIWYFVTGLQTEAVIVFFVLSGLLVAGAGAAKINSGNFYPDSYSVDRLTRLYIAFLPALLLCYALDCFGSTNYHELGYWNHTHPLIAEKVLAEPFEDHLSPTLLLMNAGMLQTFWCVPVGSNHPLWTISAEFWFYVVFGLAAVAWITRKNSRSFGWILLLIGVFLFLGVKFPVLLGYWLLGMAVAFLPTSKWMHPLIFLAGFLIVLATARLLQANFPEGSTEYILKNYAVAFAFALLVIAMRGKQLMLLERTAAFNRFLANFSFSLYLIHFPLMLFLLAVLYASFGLSGLATGYSPISREGLMIYAGLAVSIYGIAWCFSRVTEANTLSVRRYVKSAMGIGI